MIVDASALLAILFREPDADQYSEVLTKASVVRMSAANYVEAGLRVDRVGNAAIARAFGDLMRNFAVMIEPVTEAQAEIARAALRDFGRGSGHPARLNYGDSFAYALAKEAGEPLLFKGGDFIHTDIRPALAPGGLSA